MKGQFVKLLAAGIIGTAIGALGSNYDMVKSINPFDGTKSSAVAKSETQIRTILAKYKKDKKNYYLNLRLGWLYYSIGKYTNSEYFYKNALNIQRKSIEAMLGLYLVNTATRKYKTAEAYCRRVIKYDSLNYYGNLYLSYTLMGKKDFTLADRYVRKMLTYYPGDATFMVLQKSLNTAMKRTKDSRDLQAGLNIMMQK